MCGIRCPVGVGTRIPGSVCLYLSFSFMSLLLLSAKTARAASSTLRRMPAASDSLLGEIGISQLANLLQNPMYTQGPLKTLNSKPKLGVCWLKGS